MNEKKKKREEKKKKKQLMRLSYLRHQRRQRQ
jgi:hypothetical protein